MDYDQNEQNPDVNSFDPDSGESENVEQTQRNENDDVERAPDNADIPVPPDAEPKYPVEEPPADDSPVDEPDKSPKQIVSQ